MTPTRRTLFAWAAALPFVPKAVAALPQGDVIGLEIGRTASETVWYGPGYIVNGSVLSAENVEIALRIMRRHAKAQGDAFRATMEQDMLTRLTSE